MTKHKLDCGDNSCMFAENKTGARTNGGCRCTDNLGFSKSQTKAFREMAYAVIELREKLTEMTKLKTAHAKWIQSALRSCKCTGLHHDEPPPSRCEWEE